MTTKKLGIYEYRTKLLARPMNIVEIQRLYLNSTLCKTTRLAKECGVWNDPKYVKGNKRDIADCASSAIYSQKVKEYFEKKSLTTGKPKHIV